MAFSPCGFYLNLVVLARRRRDAGFEDYVSAPFFSASPREMILIAAEGHAGCLA